MRQLLALLKPFSPRLISPAPGDLEQRVLDKFSMDPDGCWPWHAVTNGVGYGMVWHKERKTKVLAHRYVYEALVGPIPEGLQLDHLCRNRGCVNPDHLEPVTQRINLLRGETIVAANAEKTECPRGHSYNEENTAIVAGKRRCRLCNREHQRALRKRRRLERLQ